MAFLAEVQREICDGEVPALPLRWWGLFCGILNFFFFGWGKEDCGGGVYLGEDGRKKAKGKDRKFEA
eukprot:evm.model.NODE_39729_length_4540_cov_17.002422.1